jgi:DNA-binding response OmpR family regulator
MTFVRILVAEDHPSLGADLKQGLERSRYAVDLVADGEDALALAMAVPYDLIVLDVMLPSLSGFEICRKLRDQKRTVPILFLTARNAIDDRVTGLDLGGDDYLTKPFAFREFEARVRALLRREGQEKSVDLSFVDVSLNTSTHEVRRGQRLITLSTKEYALLEFLLRHPRQVLSRTIIAEHVWDFDAEHFSNVIDVYIRYLRNKLCANGEPDLIQTVRGAGYQLKEPVL